MLLCVSENLANRRTMVHDRDLEYINTGSSPFLPVPYLCRCSQVITRS